MPDKLDIRIKNQATEEWFTGSNTVVKAWEYLKRNEK
jgi:hypothetical protein